MPHGKNHWGSIIRSGVLRARASAPLIHLSQICAHSIYLQIKGQNLALIRLMDFLPFILRRPGFHSDSNNHENSSCPLHFCSLQIQECEASQIIT